MVSREKIRLIKFNRLEKDKNKIGDPLFLPEIRRAKELSRPISERAYSVSLVFESDDNDDSSSTIPSGNSGSLPAALGDNDTPSSGNITTSAVAVALAYKRDAVAADIKVLSASFSACNKMQLCNR